MSHGDCPKHGRWYGICHSCAKEMQDREDFIYRESVINERNRLRTELAATKEKLARAEKVVSESAYYFSLDTLENSHKEFWEAEQNVKLAIKAYREGGE